MSQTQALAKVNTPGELMTYLKKAEGNIRMALPKHLNPDRMLRLAVTCFSQTPALRECRPDSILGSIIIASQLGLEPGVGGQGYLIPYGKTCTFVPGWQGLVQLLNNSGRATVWTGAVFEGDAFEFELGAAPKLRHVPNGKNSGDPDKLEWVYACGQVNGSEKPVIEAWPVGRVERHRDKFNKVGRRHYSYENFEMYARKVVVLQVLKYMPKSIELQNALEVADHEERGFGSKVEEGGIIIDAGPLSDDDGVKPNEPKFDKGAQQTPAPTPAPAPKAPATTPTPAPAPTPAPTPAPAPAPTNTPPPAEGAQQLNIEDVRNFIGLLTDDGLTDTAACKFLAKKFRLSPSDSLLEMFTFAGARVAWLVMNYNDENRAEIKKHL